MPKLSCFTASALCQPLYLLSFSLEDLRRRSIDPTISIFLRRKNKVSHIVSGF
jgi:hypothetical protein